MATATAKIRVIGNVTVPDGIRVRVYATALTSDGPKKIADVEVSVVGSDKNYAVRVKTMAVGTYARDRAGLGLNPEQGSIPVAGLVHVADTARDRGDAGYLVVGRIRPAVMVIGTIWDGATSWTRHKTMRAAQKEAWEAVRAIVSWVEWLTERRNGDVQGE